MMFNKRQCQGLPVPVVAKWLESSSVEWDFEGFLVDIELNMSQQCAFMQRKPAFWAALGKALTAG